MLAPEIYDDDPVVSLVIHDSEKRPDQVYIRLSLLKANVDRLEQWKVDYYVNQLKKDLSIQPIDINTDGLIVNGKHMYHALLTLGIDYFIPVKVLDY